MHSARDCVPLYDGCMMAFCFCLRCVEQVSHEAGLFTRVRLAKVAQVAKACTSPGNLTVFLVCMRGWV